MSTGSNKGRRPAQGRMLRRSHAFGRSILDSVVCPQISAFSAMASPCSINGTPSRRC